ncbi:cobalamin-independent methionine synthase II family protein [Streptomyces sp. NPDC002920]
MLRPAYLKEARSRWLAGALPTQEFKPLEDRAVDESLAIQEGAGIEVVTDGEMRRLFYGSVLCDAVDGLALGRAWPMELHHDDGTIDELASFMIVQERLRRRRSLAAEEFRYTQARSRRPVKITLPSPFMPAYLWSPEESPAAYPDPFELFEDTVALLREDIAQLSALGCSRIQIDAPELGQLGTEEQYAQRVAQTSGLPVKRITAEAADVLNALVRGFPEVSFSLHVCRGNQLGRWTASGGYERLCQEVLRHLEGFDELLLEYDTERAGTFEPLSKLPQQPRIVLGLVSSRYRALEFPGMVKARIEDAARFYPLERLALSTQCGFAAAFEGNDIDQLTQQAKLRLIGRISRQVWGNT